MQKQQFGMMDEGYFVPKSDILAWINDLLKIHISKIEALGSGSIYCQLFDVIHPGKLNLQKVNWKAKNDNQFLANFRLLQSAFQKVGIKRHIEVQKLVKAKYQDNLEFIQWFKRYFDLNCGPKGQGYDAVQKRNKIVPDFSFAQKTIVPKVYSGSGQVQQKTQEVKQKQSKTTGSLHQKKDQPPKHQISKTEKKVAPKISVKPSTILPPPRVKTDVTEKKEEPKKVAVKKQQPIKHTNPPTPAKKQDLMKKKPLSVHQTLPVKKNLQLTGVKNNSSTVHHGIQQSATKTKQLPKNELAIKQLEGKIEKIKLIVSSGKQHELMVNEIRELLNVEAKKESIKVEEIKQQVGKDIIKQQPLKQVNEQQHANNKEEHLLLLSQNIQEKKVQTQQQSNVLKSQANHEDQVKESTQVKESKAKQVESSHDEDLLNSQPVQQQQPQQVNNMQKEQPKVQINENVTQNLTEQQEKHEQNTEVSNHQNQVVQQQQQQQSHQINGQPQKETHEQRHHQQGESHEQHQEETGEPVNEDVKQLNEGTNQQTQHQQNVQGNSQEVVNKNEGDQLEEQGGEGNVIEGQTHPDQPEEESSNDVF